MAATMASADRHIVSLVLGHLSDMKYKERRQRGPDQPVEFLEYRPTLVPSLLVNRLWAEEGTSILWKRYPHLPALHGMNPGRRQWYADKVERLYVLEPPSESGEDLAYLEELQWPTLTVLELEVDWKTHGQSCTKMLHAGLSHLEFLGAQSGNSGYVAETVLPALLAPCKSLQSLHLGPDALNPEDPVHNQVLTDLLDLAPSIKSIGLMKVGFFGKDLPFGRLSQRPDLEALEIDLDPGLQILSLFAGPNAVVGAFPALRRLRIMCYPEIAIAFPTHLRLLEDLQLDVARIPDEPFHESDMSILDDLLSAISQCPRLHSLKVNVGPLAMHFPSAQSCPSLSGTSMIKLASSCPMLRNIHLIASDPSAIDGSDIFSLEFEEFCKRSPHLQNFTLKLHPLTAHALESTALQSLGKHCPDLETLRMKIPLQLPSLQAAGNVSLLQDGDDFSSATTEESNGNVNPPTITIQDHSRGASADIEYFASPKISALQPRFQSLLYLGFSRPQSTLSVASDTYMLSSASQLSSVIDPSIEKDLVQSWALPLIEHFPRLEILEAWSDWTGQDNDSLNYFLPLEEPLASTWEFLSGVEQDLWDVGEDADRLAVEDDSWEDGSGKQLSFHTRESGEDWDMASLINEFPSEDNRVHDGRLVSYEDEPDDTNTPGEASTSFAPEANHEQMTDANSPRQFTSYTPNNKRL